MAFQQRGDYSEAATLRCERALVTFLGDIGPWSKRVVLVGGLVPRYLVGSVPLGVSPHIGTTDVDLVIRLAVEQDFDTYKTLATSQALGLRARSAQLPMVPQSRQCESHSRIPV